MALRRGVDYLASLQDGREVWLRGARVEDLAGHPELGPFAHAFAQVFDWQHEPEHRDLLTTTLGTGERVSRAYHFPRSTADLAQQREMFEFLDRRCGGVMGRFPQHMAVVLLGLYAVRQRFACVNPAFPANVERYLAHCRDHDLSVATGFTDPPRDRALDASVMEYLRIVERRPDGVVIRGAKGVATVAPYADEYLGLVSPRPDLKAENILYFALPMATKGLKIVCREPFVYGDPLDHPLSAFYDEMDAWIVFDDVFVPWERVFLTDRVDLNDAIFVDIPAAWGYYSTLIRAAIKMEAIAGICFAAADYLGIRQAPHVEPLLAEVLTHLETLRLTIRAAEDHPLINDEGLALPDPRAIMVGRILSMEQHGRMLDVVRELCGTSMLMSPGRAELESPELGPILQRFLAGGDERAPDRFRVMKLAWDFANGSFAARQLLFEQHNSGTLATNRRRLLASYDTQALTRLARQLAGIE
jgi:4-hydroxyphenylacetate 3-monooxygenase